jgi:hypothetical protein
MVFWLAIGRAGAEHPGGRRWAPFVGATRQHQVKHDHMGSTAARLGMRHLRRRNAPQVAHVVIASGAFAGLSSLRDDLKKSILALVLRLLKAPSSSAPEPQMRPCASRLIASVLWLFSTRPQPRNTTRNHGSAANPWILFRWGQMRHPVAFLRHPAHRRARGGPASSAPGRWTTQRSRPAFRSERGMPWPRGRRTKRKPICPVCCGRSSARRARRDYPALQAGRRVGADRDRCA